MRPVRTSGAAAAIVVLCALGESCGRDRWGDRVQLLATLQPVEA